MLLVVITADKGLCGAFNPTSSAPRPLLPDRGDAGVELALVGRRGRDFSAAGRSRSARAGGRLQACTTRPRGSWPRSYGGLHEGEADQVFLVYNEFKSVIQQRLVVDRLLPIERHALRPPGAVARLPHEPEPAAIFAPSSPSTSRSGVAGLLESNRPSTGPA